MDTKLINQLVLYYYDEVDLPDLAPLTNLYDIIQLLLRNNLINKSYVETYRALIVPIDLNTIIEECKSIIINNVEICSKEDIRGGNRILHLEFYLNNKKYIIYTKLIILWKNEVIPEYPYYCSLVFDFNDVGSVHKAISYCSLTNVLNYDLVLNMRQVVSMLEVFEAIMEHFDNARTITIVDKKFVISKQIRKYHNKGDLYELDTIYKFLCLKSVASNPPRIKELMIRNLEEMVSVKKTT